MAVPNRAKGENYSDIHVSEGDIETGKYKVHLGGGVEEWEERGIAQLNFMKKVGLQEDSTLLDIGCGPGRAGRYFIEYLDANRYRGIDYNADFIAVFRSLIVSLGLREKTPDVSVVSNFNLDTQYPVDYLLAFSVLNHCSQHEQMKFFMSIASHMGEGSRLYVTHCEWFTEDHLSNSDIEVVRRFESDVFDAFGKWMPHEKIFPILALRLNPHKFEKIDQSINL